jgi:hypothetical protein
MVMRDALPSGMLGLMFAAFLAAFMSTISTQLNWGTSYLVNDLYRRFAVTDRDERHYVLVSRILTFALAVGGFLVATQLDSVSGAWGLLLSASAGIGLVLILRWYWWRVNAWSELVATVVPLLLVGLQLVGIEVPFLTSAFPTNLFGIAGITTACWLIATFATRPTPEPVLDAFYQRIRPGGPGWRPVAARNPAVVPDAGMGRLVGQWLLGSAAVYAALFGVGWTVLGETAKGLVTLAIAAATIAFLVRSLRAEGRPPLIDAPAVSEG